MTGTDRTPIANTRTSGYYALSREMEQRLPEFFEVLGKVGAQVGSGLSLAWYDAW